MGHVRSVGRCSLTTAPADTEMVKKLYMYGLHPLLTSLTIILPQYISLLVG